MARNEPGLVARVRLVEPTYDKWLKLWQQQGEEKYVAANGDESEPGAFKDRELMLRRPHLVVEGVILAGLMTGASREYIYVRHEHPEQIHALRREVARARQRIRARNIRFELDVLESPGGYICGEQSALIEAIEDKRAQPRSRPPELQANGLWNRPTVVNNVETFAWVPSIVLGASGGEVHKKAGRSPSRGKRLFSVSGDVRRPGVYEAPVGLPLRELLEEHRYCCGVAGELTAVAPSGPSGGLIPARIPLPIPDGDVGGYWAGVRGRLRRSADGGVSRAEVERLEQFLNRIGDGATAFDVLDLALDLNFFRAINDLLGLRPGLALGRVGRLRRRDRRARPRRQLHTVLPQRVLGEVCPVPGRLPEVVPDR